MSVEPQALERSVLESKERDELQTIAEALGLKVGARARKADLVDQILVGIGVEEPKPKPRRVRKKAEETNGDEAGDPSAQGGLLPVAGEQGAEEVAAGGPSEAPGTGVAPGALASEEEGEEDTGPIATLEPAAGARDDEGVGGVESDADRSPDDAGDGARTGRRAEEAAVEVPAVAAVAAIAPPNGAEAPTPEAAPEAGQETVERETVEQGGEATAAGDGGESPTQGGAVELAEREARPAEGERDGDRDHRRDREQRGRDLRGDRQGLSVGVEPEPGNRRSRRRRGRDRERGERDFRAQESPQEQQYSGELVEVEGLLDLRDEGYGFLRTNGYLASSKDVYISLSQVRRFGLRKGDYVKGASRPANSNEKYPALVRIDTVSEMTLEEARGRSRFEDLTPLFPDEKLRLEIPGDSANMVARIVDLISPIGKGQRGLIVSPPKAGKTTVLKQIAHSIEANNPEVHLMVLLVDERPEEVTDMRRSVKGEVIASTFDRPSDEHTQVAELAIERAKRLVEMGRDVVIVLDGITRLARAYNLAAPASGRILSGGVDSAALYPPKKFFGSARNIEEGGSLTILATALVETGSRMDEVIFEEFKGTGNMELRLDRKLAERRIYPAIDVNASSTRHEELLFERKQLELVWRLRRVLNGLSEGGSAAAGLELLMDKIKTTKSNDEFLAEIARAPAVAV